MGILMRKIIFLILIGFTTTSFALSSYWDRLLNIYQFDKSKQSYCYRNKLGRIVGENVDLQVRPASVTKLYVTLWALEALKKDHRFKTKISIYENHLHIEGGNDPYFTTENLYYLVSALNEMGYQEFDSLSFDKKFYFNWSDDSERISDLLMGYLNTTNWNEAHQLEFENLIFQNQNLGLNLPIRDEIRFKVSEISRNSRPNGNPIFTWTFQSSPLSNHLKQMNIYSSNFIAQKIFDYLGGAQKFAKFIKQKFLVGKETISFQNGAGFEPNLTTCRLTISVIERLKFQIEKQGLSLPDLISVPGEDHGTLRYRYRNHFAKTLVAKTGTLRHTSTLSGFLSTELGEKPFGIFNHSYNTDNARKLQDRFVKHLFVNIGNPQSYMYYRKDYIPLMGSILEYKNQ